MTTPPPTIAKPASAPFSQGVAVGGKADVLRHPRGTTNLWRVFLFPTGQAPRCFDVEAPDQEAAARAAWERLGQERHSAALRGGR